MHASVLRFGVVSVITPYRCCVFVGISMLLCSCDPGLHADPVGWNKVDDDTFETQIDGLKFRTHSIGGLIGESSLDCDFVVMNSARPITVKHFLLIGPLGKMQGQINKEPSSFTSREIHKPLTYWIGGDWEFDRRKGLPDIIGDGVVVEATFKYGNEERTIRVNYLPQHK